MRTAVLLISRGTSPVKVCAGLQAIVTVGCELVVIVSALICVGYPGIRAGKSELDDTSSTGSAIVQQQVVDVPRQLFDVARTGDFRSFKSIVRKSRTAAADINFQYRYRVQSSNRSRHSAECYCRTESPLEIPTPLFHL